MEFYNHSVPAAGINTLIHLVADLSILNILQYDTFRPLLINIQFLFAH